MNRPHHLLLTVALANLVFLALFVLSEPPRRAEARQAPSGLPATHATSMAKPAQSAAAPSPLPVKPRPVAAAFPDSNAPSSDPSPSSPNLPVDVDNQSSLHIPAGSLAPVARDLVAPSLRQPDAPAETLPSITAPSEPIQEAMPLDSPLLSPGVDLSVSMVWQSGRRVPGQNLTYRISYRNNGLQDATNVILTDTLPSGMSYSWWSPSSSYWSMVNAGNVITWTTSALYIGESGYIDLQVYISSGVADGTVLTNRAGIYGDNGDDASGDNQAALSITISTGDRDVAITDFWGDRSPVPGEDLVYSVSYQNYGRSSASNALITQTLAAGVSFVSASGGITPTVSGNLVIWDLGTVAGAYSGGRYFGTLNLSVHLSDSLVVGSPLCTQVEISTADPETGLAVNTRSLCPAVDAAIRDIYVYHGSYSSIAIIGTDVTLYVSYENRGNVSVHNVVLTDTLPAGLAFVSSSGPFTPTISGNVLVWNLGTVPRQYANGSSGSLYVTAHVMESVSSGEAQCGRSDISTSDTETGTGQNHRTYCLSAQAPTRDLCVSMRLDSGTPAVGNTLTYWIDFGNSGNSPAANMIITDTLPPGMTYENASGYGTPVVSGNQVVWTMPSWGANSSSYMYVTGRITTTLPAGTVMTNTVRISTSDVEVTYANNASAVSQRIRSAGIDLGLSQTWSGFRAPGQSVDYTLSYQNNGSHSATNVVITDTLPTEMTYSSYYASDWQWGMVRAGNVITWTRTSVPGGESGYIDVNAMVSPAVAVGTLVTNTAGIVSSGLDDNPGDNAATLALTILPGDRDLKLWLDGGTGDAVLGDQTSFYLSYYNNGTTPASNVLITATLPLSVSFVSSTSTVTPTAQGNTVVWNLGTVPGQYNSGYYGSFGFTVALADSLVVGDSLCTQVDIKTSDPESGPSANTATRCFTVLAAQRDLYVYIDSYSSSLLPGAEVEYDVSYGLYGNASASNVIISATLPAFLVNIASLPAYGFTATVNGTTVVWTKPMVYSGDGAYFSVTAFIPDTVSPGTALVSTARVTSDQPDTAPADNFATNERVVLPRTRDLSTSVELYYGSTTLPGNDIQYNITVNNRGTDAAANVVVTFTLPASMSYVSDSYSSGFTTVQTGDTVVWTKSSLAPYEYAYLTLTAHIAESVLPGTALTSTCTASSSEADLNPANNRFTHTLTVQIPTKDVGVSISGYSGSATLGDNLTYEIDYGNYGLGDAENVVLTVTLPVSTSLISYSTPVSATVVGNQIIWNLGRLSGNQSYGSSRQVTVRIPEQLAVPTVITATAEIATASLEKNYANNRATYASTVYIGSADLTLGKSLTGGRVAPDSEVGYRLDYQNNYWYGAALNVVLTDTLPVGMIYVASSGGPAPTVDGRQVVWNLGTVPSRSSRSVFVTATVASDVAVGTSLTNNAVIGASNESYASNNTASDTQTTVAPTRDAYISKYLSSNYTVVGSDATYSLYYYNWGEASIRHTVITDTLPPGMDYVSSTGPVTPTRSGSLVIWNLGTLPGSYYNNLQVTAHISDMVLPGAQLCNRVDISTSDPEGSYANNTSTTCSYAVAPTRDLSVFKGLSGSPQMAGRVLDYALSYQNSGNSSARNVVITDTLPSGMTYVTPSSPDSEGWTRTVSGNQVEWTRPSLGSGAWGNVFVSGRISTTVSAGTLLTNTAVIQTSDPETNYSNNQSTYGTRVLSSGVDLGVSKTWVSGYAMPNSSLTMRLTYQNGGAQTANNVIMTDTLPAGLSYGNWSDASGYWTMSQAANVLVWTRSSVAAGESGYVDLTVNLGSLVDGTQLTNSVDISSDGPDDNPADNHSTLPLTISTAYRDVTVVKSLYRGAAVPGQELTYRIEYRNHGTSAAANVLVTDTLPPGATFVSAAGGLARTVSGNHVIWNVGTVPGYPSAEYYGYVYLTLRVPDDAPSNSSFCNRADISTSDLETGLYPDTHTLCSTVQTATRDVAVTKVLDTGGPFPGTDLRYRLYFTNSGNAPADDVVITDTLPLSTTYLSYTGYVNNPSYAVFDAPVTASDGRVVWSLGTLQAGAYGYLYPTVHISEMAPNGQALTNLATISTSHSETSYSNNSAAYSRTIVAPGSDMSVSAMLAYGTVAAGNDIDYALTVSNYGPMDATNVIVTHTLPVSITYRSDRNDYGFTTVITGSTIVWTRPSLPVGFYGGVRLTGRVTDTVLGGMLLTNTTSVSASGQDANPANNMFTYTLTAETPTRDMSISSSTYSTPTPGNNLVYTINYQNSGNSAAADVIITDTLPVSTTFVSASWQPSLVAGNQVVWNVGRVPATSYSSSLQFTVRLSDDTPPNTMLVNTVDVSTSSPETNYTNNHHTANRTVYAGSADLSLTKTLLGDSLPRGSTATYALTFSNRSVNGAVNTILTETLPAELTYLSSSAPVTPTVSASTVVWDWGGVTGSFTQTIYVTVSVATNVPIGSPLTNLAAISADNDTQSANNSASDTHAVAAVERDAYISVSTIPYAARLVVYSIQYGNNGNTPARGAVLTDTLPAGTTFVYAARAFPWLGTMPQPFPPTSINGQQLVWNLDTLNNTWSGGGSGYVLLRLTAQVPETVSADTLLTNTLDIATSDVETSYANNHASVTIPVYQTGVDLQVTKSTTPGAAPGEKIEYVIDYSNRGGLAVPSGATVAITDVLPAGMVYQSDWHDGSWSVTTSGNSVVWTHGALAAGQSGSLRLTALIDGGVAPGSTLTNTVRIGTPADLAAENNSFELPLAVGAPTRDVYVRKSLESGVLVAGEDITYAVTYGNSGSGPAANLVLTDTLPTGTTFLTSTNRAGLPLPPSSVADNRLTWNFDSVNGGWYYDLKIRAHISDTLAVGTRLTNTATIATSDAEMNYANNTAVLTGTTTLGNPVPAITSVRPVSVSAGSPAFTLSVTGTDFIAGSVVRWNGAPRSTTFVSSTLVTAAIPASDIISAATATIKVFSPRPGGGESNAVSLPVEKTGTAVALTSSANPSVIGQPVSFTATVSALAPSSLTPTGTVQFQIDSTDWVTATLAGGIATTPLTSTLAVGGHSMTASYGGDANSLPRVGNLPGGQTVERAYTTVAITSSGSPTQAGQSVTFTATVSILPPGTAAMTGTVQFKDNGAAFGPTVPLSGTVASYTTSGLDAGNHPVTAEYGGAANLAPSVSITLTQQVLPASTLVNLTPGVPNPSVFGQPVLLTTTLTSGAGIPTGAVAFKEMATTLGTGTLNTNGIATTTVSSLIVGTHTITATYAGTGNFGAATSNTITQSVQKAETSTGIVGNTRNPSVIGEPVAVTFTLVAVPPGAGTPTGTVVISDGTANCIATLPALGCSLVFTTTGAHNLTARYGGDASFNTSTSPAATQTVNKANVSVALASSANPVPFADPLTFTATVSAAPPGAGAPSGTVTFKEGSTTLGTGILAGGKATFTTATLTIGSRSVTAAYEGDSAFNSGVSSVLAQTIGKARSSTVMESSANPAVFGQGISFTATVTSAVAGAGTPTGNVQFKLDSADWGAAAPLVDGRATSPVTSTLSVGNHTLMAAFSGDDGFETSSGTLMNGQIITKANTATTVASSGPSSALGESVTFTATVRALPPGAGTPAGSIQFRDDGALLGTATLSAGEATLTTAALLGGSHTIAAVYGGDGRYVGSASTGITQTVSRANPNISLTVAPAMSVFGQPVTFTTTMTSTLGVPTGTVILKQDATPLVTSALDAAGVAVTTLSSLAVGTHTMMATYDGDTNFNSVTSPSISQAVGKANTMASLTSAPMTPVFGQAVIFTATVSTLAPGAGTPTGSVTFKDEMNTLGTETLNAGGVATLITNTLSAGGSPHTISAFYGGDSNLNASPAVTIGQTVTRANVTVLVTSSMNPSLATQPVAFTATVSAVAPGAGTPEGTVFFKIDATDWITMTLANGKVSTPMTSTLSVGNHTVTVVYSGGDNFNPGTGALLGSQTVNEQSTTTTVRSSPNPSVWGEPVTLTATVTSDVGTPLGMVSFKEGTNVLGIGELSNGVTTLVTSTLAVGTHAISAEYGGNAIFNSSSGALTGGQRVKGATSTTITAHSPSPSDEGAPVTVAFSLTVTSPGGGAPSGTVTVSGGGTITCTASVMIGSCSLVFTNPGSKPLAATYAGDSNFVGSTSPGVSHTVNNLVPTIMSINPSTSRAVSPGFTLTVTGTNFIEGSVVRWNGSPRTTVFVSSTQLQAAILTTDLRTPGTASITVAHPVPAGDVSNAVPHTVLPPSSRVYLPILVR